MIAKALLLLLLSIHVDVDLIWVPGDFAVTRPEQRQIVQEAKRYLRRLPYDINFYRRTTTDQSCNVTLNADEGVDFANETLACYGSYPHRRNKLSVFMTPPLYTSDGRRGVAGVAEGVCRLYEGVAVCYVQAQNHLGQDRIQASGAALAHEIGHLLGASHTTTNPRSLMDVAPLARAPKLKFFKHSIKQMQDCYQFTHSYDD